MSKIRSQKHATVWLPLLHEIADRADGIALRLFRDAGLRVESKADDSPVSEADRAIEAMAREVIAARAPEAGVFGEEGGETPSGDGTRLIIDPIDGTRNFVRGVPVFGTLLAIEQDGVVLAGVVSAPALRARWHAARGAGAFAGARRIRVSTVSELSRAHVFHGDLSGRTEGPRPVRLPGLFAAAERTRGFGDFYQHMLVAEGAGEVAIDPKMQPWDIAAVKIVVEEAGGRATSFAGEATIHGGNLVSTNGVLHAAALEFLDSPPPSRQHGRMSPTRTHVHEEPFDETPENVFAILHTPSAIRKWWGASRAIVVPRAGGLWVAQWGSEDEPDTIATATLTVFDPPRRVVLGSYSCVAKSGPMPFEANFETEFTVRIAKDGRTILRVAQAGFPLDPAADEFYAACDRGWRATFAGIRRYLGREQT